MFAVAAHGHRNDSHIAVDPEEIVAYKPCCHTNLRGTERTFVNRIERIGFAELFETGEFFGFEFLPWVGFRLCPARNRERKKEKRYEHQARGDKPRTPAERLNELICNF